MIWNTFFHVQTDNLGGVRTLARMVFALFSSFWQCQKQIKKMGSKKVLHGARLTEGWGSKAIWAMPYGNNTFQNGASLSKRIWMPNGEILTSQLQKS